jgi:hypothetical protein
MHMAAAWVAAYNFLNIVSVYCSIEPWKRVIDSTKNEGSSFEDDILLIPYETSRTVLPQLPELRGDTHFIPEGKPRPPPKGLLPRLTPELSLNHISDKWRNEATELQKLENQQSICAKDGEDTLSQLKCPFAWVSTFCFLICRLTLFIRLLEVT